MNEIYDVYSHPAGKRLEESVGEALKAFRGRHQCEPVAVWLHPSLPDVALGGQESAWLEVKRGKRMSAWYVYLELPGERQEMLLPVDEDVVPVDAFGDEPALEPVELVQMTLW